MEMSYIDAVVKEFIKTGNNPKSLVAITNQINRDRTMPSKLNEVTATLVTAVDQLYRDRPGIWGVEEIQRTRAVTGLGLIAVTLAGSHLSEFERMMLERNPHLTWDVLSELKGGSFAESAAPLQLKTDYYSNALNDAVYIYHQIACQSFYRKIRKLILGTMKLSFTPDEANDAQQSIRTIKDTLLPKPESTIRVVHPPIYRLDRGLDDLFDLIGRLILLQSGISNDEHLAELKGAYPTDLHLDTPLVERKDHSDYALALVTGDWSNIHNYRGEPIRFPQDKLATLNDALYVFGVLGSEHNLRRRQGRDLYQLALSPKRDEMIGFLNPFNQK